MNRPHTKITGQELRVWLEESRIGGARLARMLTDRGFPVTKGRISHWTTGRCGIPAEWQERIADIMADVAEGDITRATRNLRGE
jgi:hypothetical protein